MTDIATLGFTVNTSGLKTGVNDLSAIASAAKTAEQHTASLEQAFDDLSRSSGQLKNVSQQFPQMAQQVAQVDTAVQRLSGSVSTMTSTMSRLREVTSTLQSLATVGRDVHTTLEQAEMTLTGLAAAAGALRNLANEFLPVGKAAQAVIETLQRLENAFASLQQATTYLRNLANQFFPLQKNMGDTMTTAQRMQAAFKQAFDAIVTGATALVETFQFLKQNTWLVEVAMAGLKDGMRGVGREFGEMAGEAMIGAGELEKTTGIVDELTSALAVLGISLGFKELMNYTDIFGRISVQMSQASKSALEYGESMRALYRLSQQTGQSFEETATMFARMTRATSELGLSQSQLLDVTGLVNKMLMTAQLPAASASAALFQFSQAMSSGTLRGEELNSIMEQMPPLAKAIADGMGFSVGQLRKFAAEGVLTSQNVIAALMSQKDVINEQFEAMAGSADTMTSMMSRVDNAMVMLVGKADELSGFSESINKVFSAITTGMGSPEILNAMVSVMKLLPLVIMPAVDTLQLFIEYWEELAAVFITYKITILILEAFVAWKQLTIGLTVARAAIPAIILVLNAMGVATAALTAAVKGFLIQIGIMAGVGMAIGALAAYFLLTTNNVDASQQAIEAHDKTLERLGYTADEVAEKFKNMNEEQQKLTQQEVELSIELNTQAIDDTLQKIDESFRDNMVSKWFGGNEFLQQKTEVLAEFSEIIKNGGRGLADFAQEQRNANLITEEGYQELLKLQRTMDEHKESLAEAEARLRIITNTRRGDEEATLGQNKALAVQQDTLSKLTEEWNKYIAKQIEAARTFAMNPMELATDKGQQSQRSEWAIQEAVALEELKIRYKEFQDAVRENNAAAGEAAAIQAQAANARRLEARGMEAELDMRKRLYEQGESLFAIEGRAEKARQQAIETGKEQINVENTLLRIAQQVYEEREKAARKFIETAEREIGYSQEILAAYQQRGVAAGEWAEIEAKARREAAQYEGDADEYQAVYEASIRQQQADLALKEGKQAVIDAERKHQESLQKTQEFLQKQREQTALLTAQEALRAEHLGYLQIMMESIQRGESVQFAPGDGDQVYFETLVTSIDEATAALQRHWDIQNALWKKQQEMASQGLDFSLINWTDEAKKLNAEFDQKSLDNIKSATTGLASRNAEILKGLALLTKSADSYSELAVQQDIAKLSLENFVIAGKEQKETLIGMYAEARKYQASLDLLNDVLGQGKNAFESMRGPVGKYEDAMRKAAAAEKLLADEQFIQQLKKAGVSIEQAKEYIAAYRAEAEKARVEADPMAQAFKSAAEGIYNAWSGMWESLFTNGIKGFGDMVEQLKTMFLKMIAQMAAAALAKPILLPIVQTMGGMFGLENAAMAPIVNNIFGAGTMSATGTTQSGGGGFNLFSGGGGYGISNALNGWMGGVPGGMGPFQTSTGSGFFGGSNIGFGLAGLGGYFIGDMFGGQYGGMGGSLGGIAGYGLATSSLMAGINASVTGAVTTALGGGAMSGAIAGSIVPVIGTIIGAVLGGLLGSKMGPTPHPSSIFTAGGFWQSENGPEYPGKGGGVTGASGLVYGYDYGHTDPNVAKEMRDNVLELDKVLTALAPTVDLAGVKLGEFGQTAEGFIANGEYVEDMDAVIEGFVKSWVNAAHEAGAVSELVNNALQGMSGSAEDLTKAFAVLQQMDAAGALNQQLVDIAMAVENGIGSITETLTALGAIQGYVDFDAEALFAEWETQLQNGMKTTFDFLGETLQVIGDQLADANWTDATHIQEIGELVQARYALEIQMLQEIEAYLQGLSANFGSSIEEIQLAMMSGAEKYEYFSQQAEAAFEAMKVAIDPAEIAQQAEAARQAIMTAWGMLDDGQKETVGQDYIALLQEIEAAAASQLETAQASVLSEHQATADLLRAALEAAGTAAAAAITSAATALDSAGSSVADLIATALSTPLTVNVETEVAVTAEIEGGGGYAAGGIVGGTWNGKSGTAGDTVLTALTPGEAVIPREQTRKHRELIEAIMADQVGYAANGLFLPDPGLFGDGSNFGSNNNSSTIIGTATSSGSTHHSYNKIDYSNVSILDLSKAGKDIENTTNELLDFMESLYVQIDDIARSKADRTLENLAETMADNIAKAQELGASEQQLAEVRILSAMQVQQVFNDLLTKIQNDFFGTIDEMRLSVMTDSEKYDYYTQIAEAAFDSLKTATDPAEIERLAAELNEATKSAWGLLDETQRKATLAGFEQFLVDAEDLVRTRLAESQQQALDSLGLNTEELTNQISAALGAGAEDLGAVISTAMSDSGNVIGQAIAAALEQPIPLAITVTIDGANATAEVPGMAAGGIVGGVWNGKAGIAGDTVVTALTPGEAVIPRDQTEKHRPLIEAIMADDVRYAATGTLPPANPGSPTYGQTPGNPGGWDNSSADAAADAANNAEQLAELMKRISNEIRDLGLTDFERELAAVADQLADTKEEITNLGGSALETAEAETLAALQEAKIREEYAQRLTDLLTPYQDLLSNTTELSQALRDLEQETADALEQAAQLASSEEELATARQTIQDAALLQEQALREEYARTLNDLLTPYQNVLDGTSAFQQSLRDFAVQTEDAIEQARQLGASEEQLDLIRQAAAQQQQELHQEYVRQVQDFMRPFRDINAGATEFEKALSDLSLQTEESIRQAEELGLGETYLAEIRAASALQEQELRDQYAQHLNDLLQPYTDATDNTTAFDQSLRDLARQTAEALEQAQELGASQEQLTQITEGAAAMEAKLREERQQSVDDLLHPYRTATLGMSAFTEQLAELTRQTEDALTQAQELGATEEELAEIRVGAAAMEAQVWEERNRSMADLLQPYQDTIDQTSAFDQQLRDLARQTEEAIRQAEDLNATTEELTQITEGAAAMEAKLREERQQQLDDLLTQYNAEPMTAFEQQLHSLAQQAEEAKKQAADLGASTEQLAQIDAWAAQQTAELEEQRRQSLDDLLQSYQDALDPVAGLDQQLRDLTRQMEDTLEQAQELGATEEELTLIREGAAAMAETLREDWQRQIDDFMAGFPVGVMTDFEQSLANLEQQVEDAKDQAEELGLTTEQLGQIDAWAAQQAAELEKQRRDSLDDLLQGYRDASSGATAFEQQLRDLVRQTEDAIEQAQNLGATEAELAEIRAGAAAMEAQLREEQAQKLADFMAPYEAAAAGLNDMEQAILDLQRQTEAAMAQAVELGATEADLATIRAAAMADLEQQRDDLLQSFELDMMTSYDQQVAEIKRRADEARQQLAAIDAGIAAAPGWGQDITPLPAVDFSSVIEQIAQSTTEQMAHDATELAQQTAELQDTAHETADQQADAFLQNITALETTTTQTTEQQTTQLIQQLTELERALTEAMDDLTQRIGQLDANLVMATSQAHQAIVQAVTEQTAGLMTAVAEQTAGLTAAFASAAGQIAAAIPHAAPANTDDIPGMAAGGIVSGVWNGKAGTDGDTVLTALTPGEAVIPRAQSQKHRGLIDAIITDQVQYAANGLSASDISTLESAYGVTVTEDLIAFAEWLANDLLNSGAGSDNWQPSVSATLGDLMSKLYGAAQGSQQARNYEYMLTLNPGDWSYFSGIASADTDITDIDPEYSRKIEELRQMLYDTRVATEQSGSAHTLDTNWLMEQLSGLGYGSLNDLINSGADMRRVGSDISLLLGEIESRSGWEDITNPELQLNSEDAYRYMLLEQMDALFGQKAWENANSDILWGPQNNGDSGSGSSADGGSGSSSSGSGSSGNDSLIDQWEKDQLAALEEERRRTLNELLYPYQDAIDQTSAFDQQLRDLARQTEEAIRQAEDLNATEAELAVITEGAAAMEAKLREERDRSMADLLQPYQDAMEKTTTFAAQLRDLARQTEEAIKQAQDLNATEAELATIREGAAAMETKLLEEQARQTRQLLQPYQDAIDGLTGVAAAYRDWQQQTDEAIRQAEELGLTEEELTTIREGADAQLAEMARNWREQLDELLISAREFDLSDFARSLRDLNRQISGMIEQAIDLGASEAELAEIRAYGAEQAQAMADNQIEQITDQFQAQMDQAQAELDQFTQSIDAFGQSLENNRVQIRRASDDWDEVAYQTQRLAELEARRATEETDEQLATLGEMQDAIMARYQAEQQALDEVVASIERMRNLAKQLRDFLDSLKLGNLTPLSPEARLNEAAQQYQTTLTAAQGGDEEAIADLANKAQAYLTEAQSYYASSTAYARIFDDVVASVEAIASGIESGPTTDEIIAENTGRMAQLQETTIAALNALETASRELQALADTEAQQRLDELTAEMNAQTQAIVAELTTQQLADANWINLTAAEFTLLRDVLLTISQDEIEAMSAGFAGMAEANRTLQTWMEAGQISSSADLDRVIEQLQTGSGANQTMIALLQTRVNQGGADAVQAQAMLDRLMIAQGAYDQINSILSGIKAGDVQFNADTISKLQAQLTILQNNGLSANQNANNLLSGINNDTSSTTSAIWEAIRTDNANTNAILNQLYNLLTENGETGIVSLMLIRSRLDSIGGSTSTVVSLLRDIYNKLNAGIDTYAGGGVMEPGLALVGEEGPELVRFSQPGYVYTAQETEQILGRGQRTTVVMTANDDADDTDNAEVVGELRALVRVQSAANQQLIAKLDAVESRLAGIEAKARLEAAA